MGRTCTRMGLGCEFERLHPAEGMAMEIEMTKEAEQLWVMREARRRNRDGAQPTQEGWLWRPRRCESGEKRWVMSEVGRRGGNRVQSRGAEWVWGSGRWGRGGWTTVDAERSGENGRGLRAMEEAWVGNWLQVWPEKGERRASGRGVKHGQFKFI